MSGTATTDPAPLSPAQQVALRVELGRLLGRMLAADYMERGPLLQDDGVDAAEREHLTVEGALQ